MIQILQPRLFAVRLPEALSEAEYAAMLARLPESRRTRVMSMKEKRMGYGALFSYALLRFALKTAFGAEGTPELGYGEFGKPFFKKHPEICFSLSDTKTFALCAVHDRPIGADVEQLRDIRAPLMKATLTEAEREYVGSLENTRRFFTVWTLKEAYFKLTGTGLTVPLKSVEFTFDGAVAVNKPGVFAASYVCGDCMAAVCASEPPPESVEYKKFEELID